jgi:hypothetical protein
MPPFLFNRIKTNYIERYSSIYSAIFLSALWQGRKENG